MTYFRTAEIDQIANTAGTMAIDQNGDKCAIIKVETTLTGFSFDVGMLGIVKTIQKTGEIWVYVPKGVKKLTIAHQNLGAIRDYNLGLSVQSGRTYIMKLSS